MKRPSAFSAGAGAVAWFGTACSGATNAPAVEIPPSVDAPVVAEAPSEQPQNVVLITVDTMRADYLQCTGEAAGTTPHICSLAQRGRVYTRAISPAPATLPALTSIFTHSQVANEKPATVVAHYEPIPTLAQVLQSRGLQTAAFTDHHGLGVSPASPVYPPALLQRGFTVFENFGKDRHGQGAQQVTDAARAWLTDHANAPYFVWVHYFDPHFNYRPDPSLAQRFGFSSEECGRITNGIDITEIRKMGSTLTAGEVACLVALHKAELHATDAAIGQLLEALPKQPEPLVIFASDHGEEFLDRNRIGHEWTLYNELIHVPFIVVGPGVPAEQVDRVVSTVEVYSVATGTPVALTGAVYSRTSHYYGKSPELSEVRQRANEHALVTDREKVILHPGGKVERFAHHTDPGERHTLPTVEPLLGQLESRIKALTTVEAAPSEAAADQDRAARQRLQKLGYVE